MRVESWDIQDWRRWGERWQARARELELLVGHPPLKPRPGKTIRDEMEELTDLFNDAEDKIVELEGVIAEKIRAEAILTRQKDEAEGLIELFLESVECRTLAEAEREFERLKAGE